MPLITTSRKPTGSSVLESGPLGWTGWISLQSKGFSKVFSNTTVQKHQFFITRFLYSPTPHLFAMKWSKGKARAELRPARRQSRLPHSRSLLLPGRER